MKLCQYSQNHPHIVLFFSLHVFQLLILNIHCILNENKKINTMNHTFMLYALNIKYITTTKHSRKYCVKISIKED